MSTYRLKAKTIEAVQHISPSTLVVVGKKGEQRAQPGDFIIINGPKPEDREVVHAKEFFEQYEFVSKDSPILKQSGDGNDPGDWTSAGDGTDYPDDAVASGKTSVYGLPHFESIEAAQQAAANHYAPAAQIEGDETTAVPASSKPFECTIAADPRVYAIQPSGVVAQVPMAHSDPTIDLGAPGPAGAVSEHYPHALAAAGGAVHDNPGPVSQFQNNTASAEAPLQSMGQTLNPGAEPVPEPVDDKVDDQPE